MQKSKKFFAAALAVMALISAGTATSYAAVSDEDFAALQAKVEAMEKAGIKPAPQYGTGITNDGGTLAMGDNNVYVTNSQSGIAIGSNIAYVKNANEGIAIGNMARVISTGFNTNGGLALGGQSAVINSRWGVALGANSVVSQKDLHWGDRVVSVGASEAGAEEWKTLFKGQQYDFFNKNHTAFTRRIINVSDGINDSDAATVGQIKKLTSAEAGVVKYTYDDSNKKYTDNVKIKGNMAAQKFDFVDKDGNFLADFTVKDLETAAQAAKNAGMIGIDKNGQAFVQTKAASNAVALGTNANAKVAGSVAIGAFSKASGSSNKSTAIGYGAQALKDGAVALGADSVAQGDGSISVGHKKGDIDIYGKAYATDYFRKVTNVADGTFAKGSTDVVTAGQLYAAGIVPGTIEAKPGDTAKNSIAIGEKSKVTGNNSIAIGGQALSSADVVLGQDAKASGANATAIGNNSHATAGQSTALGQNAWATAAGSVALGNNSVANEANTVSVGKAGGERRIVNVAAGTKDTDAVNKAQLDQVDTKVEGLDKLTVKYDSEAKDTVTFGGTNGTALKNISEINGEGDAFHIDQYGHGRFNDIMITDGNATMGPNSNNVKVLLDDQHSYINGVAFVNGSILGTKDGIRNGNRIDLDGDSIYISADDNTSGLTIGAGQSAVRGDFNVTGKLSTEKGLTINGGGLDSSYYGYNYGEDGKTVVERNQSFLKQDGDGVSFSYKHVNANTPDGDVIDVDNTFTFGKDGVKLSGKDGAALKVTGVAAGTEDTDAVNFKQLGETVTEATKDAVQWDDAAHTQISGVTIHDGLVNANNVIAAKATIGGVAFDGLGNLTAQGDITAKTGTIGGVTFAGNGQINGVAAGIQDTDAVNVKQLNETVTGAVAEGTKDAVKYDSKGELHAGKEPTGKLDLKNDGSASISSSNGNSVTVGQNGTTITGNAEVTGDFNVQGKFSVNGKEIATQGDIKNLSGAIGEMDENGKVVLDNKGTSLTDGINKNAKQIGLNEDGTYKEIKVTDTEGKTVTNLTDAVNANNDKIAATNKVVGDGKLDNKAENLTAGINQNTADILQNRDAINSLGRSVNKLGGEIDSVGAISAALAGLHPIDYDPTQSKYQLSAALGSYDGSSALALGGFYNFNKDVLLSLGVSTALKGERKTAGNLGVTFRIGSGADKKAVPEADKDILTRIAELAQKVSVLEQKNDKLEQENADQKKQIEVLQAKTF